MSFIKVFLFTAVLFQSGVIFAQPDICKIGDLNSMTWTERFHVYSRLMYIESEEQREECLVEYFYGIREKFIEEANKGSDSYQAFFNQLKEDFAIDAIKDTPEYTGNILDHVSPLILFLQQVWMEEALDEWILRKRDLTPVYAVGGAVLAATVLIAYVRATRKMSHRPIKVLMRVFRQLTFQKVTAFGAPSVVQASAANTQVVKRFRKPKHVELPLSPFDLTYQWFNKKQQDMLDPEVDQFLSDVESITAGAVSGTLSGLAVAKIVESLVKLSKHGSKLKPVTLVSGMATTMVTTHLIEEATADMLTKRDFLKVQRRVAGALYDIDNYLYQKSKAKAYVALYDLVNEIEMYALLKAQDFSLAYAKERKMAIRSCWPAWSDEEIENHAHNLHVEGQDILRHARALISSFQEQSKNMIAQKFPYFPERLSGVLGYMDLLSDEKYLAIELKEAIVQKNECYKR